MEVVGVWHDRRTYICLTDRFTSKYPGQCPQCRATLLGMHDLDTPKKRDDRGWKKLELAILVFNSGIQLCSWSCCVPIVRPHHKGNGVRRTQLTLSQFKASIRKRREHHQGEVPRYYKYR